MGSEDGPSGWRKRDSSSSTSMRERSTRRAVQQKHRILATRPKQHAVLTADEPARSPPGLVGRVRQAFRLDWNGIHGAGHWARVAFHGRYMAKELGVPPLVPHLFALLHDAQRQDEGRDPDHGPRAARFVRQLQAEGRLGLGEEDLDLPAMACEGHSAGSREAPLIVQVCWDADRLDLGRWDSSGSGPPVHPVFRMLATLAFAWAWSTSAMGQHRQLLPKGLA